MKCYGLSQGLSALAALLCLGLVKAEVQTGPQEGASIADRAAVSQSAPRAGLQVLFDQTANITNTGVGSQDFENPDWVNQAADDFIVPENATWQIEAVLIPGFYFNGEGATSEVNLFFYADDEGRPGTELYAATNSTAFADEAGEFYIDLSADPLELDEGHYWVSVQARLDFSPNGDQWAWFEHVGQTHEPSVWRQPASSGDCADWGERLALCDVGSEVDMAFRLDGTEELIAPQIEVTPEAISLTLDMGESESQSLEIANPGDLALDWAVDESPQAQAGWPTRAILDAGALLVSNHSTDQAMALDPLTGDVIEPALFPINDLHLVYKMLAHPDGERLLATSQNHHVVYEFDLDGQLLGVFAPASGADTDLLRNVRSMAFHPTTGNLIVSNGHWRAYEEFDLDGNHVGMFIPDWTGGIAGPMDLLFRDDDLLLTDTGGAILRFNHDGTPIARWNMGASGTQQIIEAANGNVLVAAFGSPSGLHEYLPHGERVALHDVATNLRGVHELPGGNILVSNSSGLRELDPDGQLVRTISSGNLFMITSVQFSDCELPDWLSLNVSSGTIEPGAAADSLQLTIDTDGLAPGEHQARLCLTNNDPNNPLAVVPISVTVEQTSAFGGIQGTVQGLGYCNEGMSSLAGATVTLTGSSTSHEITTNEAGQFSAFLPTDQGPLSAEIAAANFLTDETNGISLPGGQVVNHNVTLEPATPCLDAVPAPLELTIDQDEQDTVTFDLANLDGNVPLDWAATVAEPLGNQTGAGVLGEPVVPAFSTTGGFSPIGYVGLDASQPGTLALVNGHQPREIYAATFIDNDFSRHYMLASGDGTVPSNMLGYADVNTGVFTNVGQLSNVEDGTWTSMKWDHSTAELYAVLADGNNTARDNRLYRIDPVLATATEVGLIEGPGFADNGHVMSIAIAPDGQMYALDVTSNQLLSIDKHSAEATAIGSLGQTPQFAQDMDFDQTTGTLYWAGYMGTGNSEMFTIDTDTGWATGVGSIEDGIQLLSFSIALPGAGFDCDASSSVSWLNVVEENGSVASGLSGQVELGIDSQGLAPGHYQAAVCLSTNDPLYSQLKVPVELTVNIPPEWAILTGTVDTSGYCEADPATLAGAEVVIDNGEDSWTTHTAADGSYHFELPPEAGPVDMVVTAQDHQAAGDTEVELEAFSTTVRDFTLLAELGCTTTDSESIATILTAGGGETHEVMLSNSGPAAGEFVVTSIDLTLEDPTYQVLVISPDAHGGSNHIPPQNLVDDLNAFDDVEADFFDSPVSTLTLADVEDYHVVITVNSAAWSAQNADVLVGDILADFVDLGGKVILHNFAYDNLGFQLRGRFMTESYGPITHALGSVTNSSEMVVLDDLHPLFDGVETVGHEAGFERLTGSSLTPGATLLAEWSDEVPMLAINDHALAINTLYSQDGAPSSWNGDLNVIVYNAVRTLTGTPEMPADWLSFTPAIGEVDGGASQTIEVEISADSTMASGVYLATMVMAVDGGEAMIEVPVELEVLKPDSSDQIFRDCFVSNGGDSCPGAPSRLD